MSMEKKILEILSGEEKSFEELRGTIKDEKLNVVLKEMEKSGLIFLNRDQRYSITLLGKILLLGLKEAYEKITERMELFNFFRTRIPSKFPDEILLKFRVYEDFKMIGKPDLTERKKEIMNTAIGVQPHAEKEIYISAPDVYRPTLMHLIGALKTRPQIKIIFPEEDYKKSNILLRVTSRVIKLNTRIIKPEDQYMGLLIIDNKFCFFGFRNIENKPGWDAVIYTETRECIEWVKENFDYMWKNLAFSEE